MQKTESFRMLFDPKKFPAEVITFEVSMDAMGQADLQDRYISLFRKIAVEDLGGEPHHWEWHHGLRYFQPETVFLRAIRHQ